MKTIDKIKEQVLEQGCISEVDIFTSYVGKKNISKLEKENYVTFSRITEDEQIFFNLLFTQKQLQELFNLIVETDCIFCFDVVHKIPLNKILGFNLVKRQYRKDNEEYIFIDKFGDVSNNCILISKEYFQELPLYTRAIVAEHTLFNKEIVQTIRKEGDSHE